VRDVTKSAPSLEAEILKLINPAPELQADCLVSIREAFGSLRQERAAPWLPPSPQKRKLMEDTLRGLRIVKTALAARADFLGHDVEGRLIGYEEIAHLYAQVKGQAASWDSIFSGRYPRSGRRRDPVMWMAVYEACELLTTFGKTPPPSTKGGIWHRLALKLYHSHGGRSDVYQAMRDYRRTHPVRQQP
jgi:hypothetical protein